MRLATRDHRFARITCSIFPLKETPPEVVSPGLIPMPNNSRARIDSTPGAVIANTFSRARSFFTWENYGICAIQTARGTKAFGRRDHRDCRGSSLMEAIGD